MTTSVLRRLGYLESAQAYCSERYPFNAIGVLRFKSTLSPERLRAALSAVQRRHPLLNVQIARKGARWVFQIPPPQHVPVQLIHSSVPDVWIEATEEYLNLPLEGWPLLRCSLVKNESGQDDLLVCAHHAIIDVSSGTCFLNELLDTYDLFARGEAVTANAERTVPKPAEQLFPKERRGIKAIRHLGSFLFRQGREEFAFRSKGKGPELPVASSARCRFLPFQLSEAFTSTLARQGRRSNLTVNSLLLAAMLVSVVRETSVGDPGYVRYITVADLRPKLGLEREDVTLSSYFSMLRFGLDLDPGGNLGSLAAKINVQVYEAMKRGDPFSALVCCPMMMRMVLANTRHRMATAALSFSGHSELVRERASCEVIDFRSCVSNFPMGPPCTAQARISDGMLKIDFVFMEQELDSVRCERIVGRFERVLIEWVAAAEAG